MVVTSLAAFYLCLSQQSTAKNVTSLTEARNLQGKQFTIDLKAAFATLILFIATDCPIANRYAPEIERITKEYKEKGVKTYRVYFDTLEDADEVEQHAVDFSLTSTPLLDTEQLLAKRLKATVTPEAFVFLRSGKIAYRGRIDDINIEHGKVREDYRRDLRIALDEVLAGKAVSVPQTVAIGCLIPPPAK